MIDAFDATQSSLSAERLVASMDRTGCVSCVGLDPVLDRLPDAFADAEPIEALRGFSLGVVEEVASRACCIKIQSACFERFGPRGAAVIDDILAAAAALDLPVILDAKRGDIGISARHYAASAFERCHPPDWVTVNGYLGGETIEPWLTGSGGVFVLVRTSNPGADDLQALRLEDGRTVSDAAADMVAAIAAPRRGPSGWSSVGAVVGATRPAEAELLRERMPGVLLLVPGIGAQGGAVDDCRPLLGEDGRGAILTASRSVIYADGGRDWRAGVRDAAEALAEATGRMAGLR